ncbi:MAG: hypothetical protein IT165_32365 [Bryobacterales bacterium]|nr:hypothetical protein [Bryobacterales bacterium]
MPEVMAQDAAARFEEAYGRWLEYCKRPEIMEASTNSAYCDNDPFREMVALGEAAIPYIIGRLKSDEEAHFLVWALEEIAPGTFRAEDVERARARYGDPLGNQGRARMWIEWWEQRKV